MFNQLYLFLGICLVLLAWIDATQTTAGVASGGVVTRRLSDALWKLVAKVIGTRKFRPALRAAGVGLIFFTLVVWLILQWVGWSLIFFSSENLRDASDFRQGVGMVGIIDHVGSLLSTLGRADYRHESPWWGIAAAIASLGGFFSATLGISYIISVTSAAVSQRVLAATVFSLGRSYQEMLSWCEDEAQREALKDDFVRLGSLCGEVEQQLYSFPALRFLHSQSRRQALSVALYHLYSFITILLKDEQIGDGVFRARVCTLERRLSSLITTCVKIQPASFDNLKEPPALCGVGEIGTSSGRDQNASFERRRDIYNFALGEGWSDQEIESPLA